VNRKNLYTPSLFVILFCLIPSTSLSAITANDGFNPISDNPVYTMAIQPDGKILVGGGFTTISGQPRDSIARLNPDGSLDTSFDPGTNGLVLALALQPDGKILVGGLFTMLSGVSVNCIGRLNQNGSIDTTFNLAGTNGMVYAMTIQPDRKILVGGDFTTLMGQPRENIGRLNQDGSLDTSFNPGANKYVISLVIQNDDRILVAHLQLLQEIEELGELLHRGREDDRDGDHVRSRLLGRLVEVPRAVLLAHVDHVEAGDGQQRTHEVLPDVVLTQKRADDDLLVVAWSLAPRQRFLDQRYAGLGGDACTHQVEHDGFLRGEAVADVVETLHHASLQNLHGVKPGGE